MEIEFLSHKEFHLNFEYKDLGGIIDEKLSFTKHTVVIISKADWLHHKILLRYKLCANAQIVILRIGSISFSENNNS